MLERYTPLLNAIQEICATAHIAGGAVRDTLLERPIRDIDLFLDEAATDKAAALLRSQFGFVKVGEWKSYELFSDPAVSRVAKFEKADESIPLCLIGLHRPSDAYYDEANVYGMQFNLSRFDFGICMAGWDGDKVYTAPEFKRDVERKIFTLLRADNQAQFDYSKVRYDKMTKDRYAGWWLVVPRQFEAFVRSRARRQTHYYDCDTDAWKLRDFGSQVPPSPKPR